MMPRSTDTAYKTLKGTRKGKRSSTILVPEAKNELDNLKLRVATDLGIDFSVDDRGNFTAKQCGQIGGEMVRRIIEQVKLDMMNDEYRKYQ